MTLILLRSIPSPSPSDPVSATQEARIAAVRLADLSSKVRRIVERPMTAAARDQARDAMEDAVKQLTVLRRSI